MRKNQQGASFLMVLVWMLIGISVITLGLKIGPIYLDDFAVSSSLDGLKRESDLAKLSNEQIVSRLEKHFTVNNVRNFDKKNIKITREKTKVVVALIYEVRTNIVSNIDAVVSFNHQLEANNQ
ncbi:DUF4845 domain-containing protein [Hahella aquimaris]|uniref:DUF4845 domain-containing protein n=1 Tax=Hahella sp. HNIBRBA332 TaxID=3015983 RepID=UPI00273CA4CF|nr:DUF4845 domain-containing protein [Hahella sp. HNIBRBA332]WLQ11513.1 DUF4845 domain-containing protein [Hahella sp. HNIBRBA332]